MDTSFAQSALQNAGLYKAIVAHRKKFNSIPSVDYDTHHPSSVRILPPDNLMLNWRDDYEQLRKSFIYEEKPKSFDELSARLKILTDRLRAMSHA